MCLLVMLTGNVDRPGELMTQRVEYSVSAPQFLMKGRKKQVTYNAANHDARRLVVQ